MDDKPDWQVGQWWSYVEHREDCAEWFNQTVVGTMTQSGDLASINFDEMDFTIGPKTFSRTVFSMVPPVIGWKLPPDPQVPGHWLLWNGSKNWDGSVTLWDP